MQILFLLGGSPTDFMSDHILAACKAFVAKSFAFPGFPLSTSPPSKCVLLTRATLPVPKQRIHNRWREPNGTHFVGFEPQCTSMRAGFANVY